MTGAPLAADALRAHLLAMPRALVLQHAAAETPGTMLEVLRTRGFEVSTVRTFENDAVPRAIAGHDALVVMGGPMSAYDPIPHLQQEIALVRDAIARDIPVLGICLGSQLVASALGARVYAAPKKEIGWFPITLERGSSDDPMFNRVPKIFNAFHWHGDVFDLPSGAVTLASSAQTKVQAFRHGRAVYAFLFHMEVDASIVSGMASAFPDELRAERIDPSAVTDGITGTAPTLRRIAMRVFSAWVDRV